MWYIMGAVAAVLILFLAVILVRAAMFKPREQGKPSEEKVSLNEEKIVQDMSELLRCKTISYNDESLIDEAEFEKFRQLLPKLYPQVHKVCTLERIGKTGLLYHWKGKTAEAPAVLMSHYDVVPVEEDQWEKPAFEGIVENGEIWGRGNAGYQRNALWSDGGSGSADRTGVCAGARSVFCFQRTGGDQWFFRS